MIRPVELSHASRLINHGPTVLITSMHNGRRNVMAAAWSMPVEFTPPRIAVVIDKSTYTRELITNSGSFGISIPCRANVDLVYTVGSVSGRPADAAGADADKFSRYGIAAFAGRKLGLPCVKDCVAWLECRVLAEPVVQERYDSFFGEVVSAQADSRVFADGRWNFAADNTDLHTLHHLGGGLFALPVQTIQAQMLPAAD